MARDALLRALRAPGFRALPRLRGAAVKDFFLNYDETRSNDFVLEGTGQVELFKTDISDWRITFVDTGLHSEIGERLRRVRRFVEGEEMFLANYADVFTDAPLPDMISRFAASDAAVSLLAVPPQSSHHVVDIDDSGVITQVSRCGNCASGRTADTSSCGRRSSITCTRARTCSATRSRGSSSGGKVLAYPYKGYWIAGRHREGAGQAGGDVLPGQLPLDGVGPGALGQRAAAAATRPGGPRGRPRSAGAVMLALRLDRPGERRCPSSRSARTPTTSRSALAALLLSLAGDSLACASGMWCMTGTAERHAEARAAARAFMPGADLEIALHDLPEGRLPAVWRAASRRSLEAVARSVIARPHDRAVARRRAPGSPDHRRDRADRLPRPALSRLRDPQMGWRSRPPVSRTSRWPTTSRGGRSSCCDKCYPSQRGRDWWDEEMFLGLARLRGMECRARYAEAFTLRKADHFVISNCLYRRNEGFDACHPDRPGHPCGGTAAAPLLRETWSS